MRLAGHPVSVTAIHSRMSGGPPRLRPDSSLHSWRLATSTQPGGAHLPPPVWPPSAVTSAAQFSNGPSCLLSSCSCRPGLHRLRHEQPDWHHSSLHSAHASVRSVTTQDQLAGRPSPLSARCGYHQLLLLVTARQPLCPHLWRCGGQHFRRRPGARPATDSFAAQPQRAELHHQARLS